MKLHTIEYRLNGSIERTLGGYVASSGQDEAVFARRISAIIWLERQWLMAQPRRVAS